MRVVPDFCYHRNRTGFTEFHTLQSTLETASMVKLSVRFRSIKMTESKIIPAPPQLFRSLVAGFDTITNHIALILFPIGLDLLFWLGPRLSLKHLIDQWVGEVIKQSLSIAPDAETLGMLESAQELWSSAGDHFNLFVALKSYPIGIPSLMASILPLEMPLGTAKFIEIESLVNVTLMFLGFSFIGLMLGSLFFLFVSEAAVQGEIRLQRIIKDWPWTSLQVLLLTLTLFVLFFAVSIPAGCVISFAVLGSMVLGQCAILMYAGFLIWIIFPLLFSAHGIFVNRQKVWMSIKRGINVTRLTLPTTSLFFLIALLLIQGLDFLWRVPPTSSWLMLIGLAGHAFVSTGLISASFIYYRAADRWISSLNQQNTLAQVSNPE